MDIQLEKKEVTVKHRGHEYFAIVRELTGYEVDQCISEGRKPDGTEDSAKVIRAHVIKGTASLKVDGVEANVSQIADRLPNAVYARIHYEIVQLLKASPNSQAGSETITPESPQAKP